MPQLNDANPLAVSKGGNSNFIGEQTIAEPGAYILPNPIKNVLLVTLTANDSPLTLPAMNATNSFPLGKRLLIFNFNAYTLRIYKSGNPTSGTADYTIRSNGFLALTCINNDTAGGQFITENLSVSDIADLQTALDAKQDITTIPFRASVLTVTALKGISTTSLPEGAMILVRNVGVFRYNSTAVNTSDDTIYVTPNSGTGRWIRVTNNIAVQATRLINSGTSDTVVATDFAKEITVSVTDPFAYNLPDSTTLYLTRGFYFDVIQSGTGAITFTPLGDALVYGNPVIPGASSNATISKSRVELIAANIWLVTNLAIESALDAKADTDDVMLRGFQQLDLTPYLATASLNGAYVGADIVSANQNVVSGPYFPADVDSWINFTVALPKRWNGGFVYYRIIAAANATTGDALWRLSVIARVNGTAFNFAPTQYDDLTLGFVGTAYAPRVSAISSGMVPDGINSYPCQLELRLIRNGASGSDTLAAPAILENLVFFYAADKGNDA